MACVPGFRPCIQPVSSLARHKSQDSSPPVLLSHPPLTFAYPQFEETVLECPQMRNNVHSLVSIPRTRQKPAVRHQWHILVAFTAFILLVLACVAPGVSEGTINTSTRTPVLISPSSTSTATVVLSDTATLDVPISTVTITANATIEATRSPTPSQVSLIEYETPQPQSWTHVVREGEWLWTIARDECSDSMLWVRLATVNDLEDNDTLQIGSVIVIDCGG